MIDPAGAGRGDFRAGMHQEQRASTQQDTSSGSLRVATWVDATRAEGPGLRAALWVAGCSVRCPGCCNPELFEASAGRELPLRNLQRWIVDRCVPRGIEGLSVLGGEPLEQWAQLAPFLAWLRSQGLGVIVFSGLRWERLRKQAAFEDLPSRVDTLVDGPFVRGSLEPVDGRAVVGSSNQKLWHFSPRYEAPELWSGPPRAELHLKRDGSLHVHGAPRLVEKIRRKLRRTDH